MNQIEFHEFTEHHGERIAEAHALLRDVIPPGSVEDFESFGATVSRMTDADVVPGLVCAAFRGRMVGVCIGAYLRNLDMSYAAYSAVRPAWRRRGIYSKMRARLLGLLGNESPTGEALYLISELDEGSRLYRRYLSEWKAFVLPCDYEQPEAQGLCRRPAKLVIQPLARRRRPDESESLAIVRELYERIYRIDDAAQNESYRRIAASLRSRAVALPTQGELR